jgi:hypothetical protein
MLFYYLNVFGDLTNKLVVLLFVVGHGEGKKSNRDVTQKGKTEPGFHDAFIKE